MKSIKSIDDINKILRNELIKQSQIDGKNILNSLSEYGEDLDKLIEKSIYNSYEKSNIVILFELLDNNQGTNVSYTNDDNDIIYYKSYSFYIMIYGDNSSSLSNIIASRMRTEKVRIDLLSNGLHIEEVTNPHIINEYKNQKMWIRNDININISCMMNISQIELDNDFKSISLNIINKQ